MAVFAPLCFGDEDPFRCVCVCMGGGATMQEKIIEGMLAGKTDFTTQIVTIADRMYGGGDGGGGARHGE